MEKLLFDRQARTDSGGGRRFCFAPSRNTVVVVLSPVGRHALGRSGGVDVRGGVRSAGEAVLVLPRPRDPREEVARVLVLGEARGQGACCVTLQP